MVRWPCSSAFREKGNDGAKNFEKGGVKHRNAWPHNMKTSYFQRSTNCLGLAEASELIGGFFFAFNGFWTSPYFNK